MRSDRDPTGTELPTGVATVGEPGFAQQRCVVRDESVGVLRSDEDAVEVQSSLLFDDADAAPGMLGVAESINDR